MQHRLTEALPFPGIHRDLASPCTTTSRPEFEQAGSTSQTTPRSLHTPIHLVQDVCAIGGSDDHHALVGLKRIHPGPPPLPIQTLENWPLSICHIGNGQYSPMDMGSCGSPSGLYGDIVKSPHVLPMKNIHSQRSIWSKPVPHIQVCLANASGVALQIVNLPIIIQAV